MAQETQPVHDVKKLIRIRGGHKAAFTNMEIKIDQFIQNSASQHKRFPAFKHVFEQQQRR